MTVSEVFLEILAHETQRSRSPFSSRKSTGSTQIFVVTRDARENASGFRVSSVVSNVSASSRFPSAIFPLEELIRGVLWSNAIDAFGADRPEARGVESLRAHIRASLHARLTRFDAVYRPPGRVSRARRRAGGPPEACFAASAATTAPTERGSAGPGRRM